MEDRGDCCRVAVIGASGGIGRALVDALVARDSVEIVYACSRSNMAMSHPKIVAVQMDLTNEQSLDRAVERIEGTLDLTIVATGFLGDETHQPEKALREFDAAAMMHSFAVNAVGPALVAKRFLPLLPKGRRGVFVALSARVGSISDNRLGGWYSYRSSKAALNMLLKTAAIEVGRRYPQGIVVGYHPGTVDTPLSQPYQRRVRHDVFSPAAAAGYLLDVVDRLLSKDTGKCFDWRGEEIPP